MKREQEFVGQYYRLAPRDRLDRIYTNFDNFPGIIADYELEMAEWIKDNLARARRQAVGELGVRIQTSNVKADDKTIPENIWDVILDNSFEAVTNALKYSGCSEISISIMALGEVVRCVIKDNGKGAENVVDGMGIQGMKQRVRNVKGYFDIETLGGFTINMILPIKGKEGKQNGTD